MPTPTVTVLMPAYNCELFVGAAIQAVLEQTFRDFELIVINDGSTDRTGEVIRGFEDERILFLENERNCGIVKTLNRGLDVAKGKYVLRTDADDIALKDMMLSLVEFMEANPDHIVCGGNMQLLDGKKIYRYISGNEELKLYTLNACPFSHSTVIFRREILEKRHLRYSEIYKDGEDHGLWSELLPYGKFHNLDKVTLLYRESNTQVTSRASYTENYGNTRAKIFSFHARKYFDLGEKEAGCYVNLIMQRSVSGIAELEEIGRVILKIIEVNGARGYFSPDLLRKTLFVKWHWICLQSYHLGKGVFKIYLRYLVATGNMLRVRSMGTHFFKSLQS